MHVEGTPPSGLLSCGHGLHNTASPDKLQTSREVVLLKCLSELRKEHRNKLGNLHYLVFGCGNTLCRVSERNSTGKLFVFKVSLLVLMPTVPNYRKVPILQVNKPFFGVRGYTTKTRE